MKLLAKDTAIYGGSSMLGKMLNWLMLPLFTYTLATTREYGIVTNLYPDNCSLFHNYFPYFVAVGGHIYVAKLINCNANWPFKRRS